MAALPPMRSLWQWGVAGFRCRALDSHPTRTGEAVAAVLLNQRDKLARIEGWIGPELDLRALGSGIDLDHPERPRDQPQPGAGEERLRLLRRQPEAVDQFLLHFGQRGRAVAVGEPLVQHQALVP